MSHRRARLEALAALLDAIASPPRLELLHEARSPTKVGELRVHAVRTRKGERAGRLLARPTVAHHVDALEEAGLLRRVPSSEGADQVVLDHVRLFALIDELRHLAKLRPIGGEAEDGRTLFQEGATDTHLPSGPRLLVAYGRDDGMAFGLDGKEGASWVLGRSSACQVMLDYDPYASGEHARVTRTPHGHEVEDLGSRNGTWVNWRRLEPGARRVLNPGALLLVGRSLLVFQDEPSG